MFDRVLVANRGEIAVRIMRTCREMGISPVAVYSEPDRAALHVRSADHAVLLGPAPASQSYLSIDAIIDAARRCGAEAIHPGYGFLSENARFAEACADAGIAFIGPPAEAIRAMGDKMVARERMQRAGVPVVPGVHGEQGGLADAHSAVEAAREVGLPVMLKAKAGGGGKGMRLVEREGDLEAALSAARREALAAFGEGTVYMEKAIVDPRHVEVQVMVDASGVGLHFYERDCSVQRRHQKVIEETPCPVLDDELRREMGAVAVRAALAVDYRGAGTVEFLFDSRQRRFYFLEMNTRLQVEHPITELCCGVDLVRMQIATAAGQPLGLTQADIAPRGAAIECRVYAEDPVRFLPSPGVIRGLSVPSGPGIRDDSGVYPGVEITTHYDPLISKLTVWAEDRPRAIARMRRALDEYAVIGIETNLPFHRRALRHRAFVDGDYHTGFVGHHADELTPDSPLDPAELIDVAAAALVARPTPGQAPSDNGVSRGASTSPWRRSARWRRWS